MKHKLRFETEIRCSVETLFEFHSDTNNLPLITPPDTEVEILEMASELREGNEARLHIRKGMIGFTWHLVFDKVEPPHLIVDRAVSSPFRYFRHEHRFIKTDDNRSILVDEVFFTLPFEPFSLFLVGWVKRDMAKMFVFRHRTTKHLLEKESNLDP